MLTGKKVLVIGLARSGKAAVELLDKLHASITVNEYAVSEKIDCYDDYVSRGIEMITGGHPEELFERDFDFVVKNPGINYRKPFILRLKEKNEPKWIYPIIFSAYIGCSLLTFSGVRDIVPMAAALLCALALIQKKPTYYRIVILLNGALWVVYDIFIQNYGMLASHIITVASALIGIIRCDVLKK